MCALKEEHGLSYEQGHANVYDFLNPKADHEFHQTIMERCVLASEKMGIPWLVVHPSTAFSADAVYAASRSGNTEYFKRLCEFAAKHGVGIAVENMWDLHTAPKNAITRIMQRSCASSQTRAGEKISGLLGLGACAHLTGQDQKKSLKIIGNRLKVTLCVRLYWRGQYPCNAFPGKNRLGRLP